MRKVFLMVLAVMVIVAAFWFTREQGSDVALEATLPVVSHGIDFQESEGDDLMRSDYHSVSKVESAVRIPLPEPQLPTLS